MLGKIINRQAGDEDRIFKILSRKGIFPYEFIDCIEKLKYDKKLKIRVFYSRLNDENISEKDFGYYLKVWNMLKEETLGNYYSDLYNIQGILLLADIFENFRNACLPSYKLDPAPYLTSPSLGWDAMLKLTKTELELMII